MKKLFWILVILFILALDLAALNDILQGEPNPYGEIAMLAASLIAFVGIAAYKPYKE